LESDKPEELLLAILANFEQVKPEMIIAKIFIRAQMITNETFSLEKFVSQFEVFQNFVTWINYLKLSLIRSCH
jgi:hypothetical protein